MIAARLGRGSALPRFLWGARHLSQRGIVAMGPGELAWATEARALMAPQDAPLALQCRVAVIRTSGGAFAARWSGSPGVSAWMLEDAAPYAVGAQATLLPDALSTKANSRERAHDYAEFALARALTIRAAEVGLHALRAREGDDDDDDLPEGHHFSEPRGVVMGLGCCAVLGAGEGEREGRTNEAWICALGADGKRETRRLRFAGVPGADGGSDGGSDGGVVRVSRGLQDLAVSAALAEAAGDAHGRLCLDVFRRAGALLSDDVVREAGVEPRRDVNRALLLQPAPRDGEAHALFLSAAAARAHATPIAVVPGSFHPVHEAHLAMARGAADALAREGGESGAVVLELTLSNADKGGLGLDDARRRLAVNSEIMRGQPDERRFATLVTRERLLVDKARLFSGSPAVRFAVGFDTAVRVLDAKYYPGEDGLGDCLAALRDCRAKFFVAGRDAHAGKPGADRGAFLTADDLPVHVSASGTTSKDLFLHLPGWTRNDVSSSAIRAAAAAKKAGS
ncbi:hypothetical protein M885DRAFT_589720 [Pelagophyceae sp. CCMP2097]|nr:hypothetical protein M885DRAFT_589720 [Pelagophyceae sp. CCMP2097]